jgi:hypothetical protein
VQSLESAFVHRALIAGNNAFGEMTGSVMSATKLHGAEMVMVAGFLNKLLYRLIARDLGLHFGGPPEYWRLVAWLDATKGVFFRGWVFLCAAVATIWIGARRRCWSAVAVAASGVCYVIPYAVITTGADFRYVWWLVVSSLAGTALLVTDRTGRHRAIPEAGS